MAQSSSGIRSILEIPVIYDVFQSLVGAKLFHQEFVKDFIRPTEGAKLLDIGCGTAQILACLPSDITYVGYDPSPEYIARARRNFGRRAEFTVGFYDEAAASSHTPFDLALATGVLHHMDDEQVIALCELVRKSLKPQGRFVTIDGAFCSEQTALARFLTKRDRGANVRRPEEYVALVTPHFVEVKTEVKNRFWYTFFFMECFV
ncbi:MAG TPA: class I SAM-dependent methyltransferase [Syntrophobacteraceae bacterium]|nr:class I SAM-dependent methyltransferase [Syntrophobacteraceae bacterium]